MKKNKYILVLGDIHLKKDCIDEIDTIINEIYFEDADNIKEVIFLGDVFNQSEKRPNAEVLNFVTKTIVKMLQKSKITICVGNHESIKDNISTLDYLQWLGVELIYTCGIIEREGHKIYIGHHFLAETPTVFKDERYKLKDLQKKADLILLGHDHSYRKYSTTAFCLGSIRRVLFSESEYGSPRYAKLYTAKSLNIDFYDVKRAIPMIDVHSIKELLKIEPETKVRLIFNKFEDFLSNINNLKELEKKFHMFRIKHDYTLKTTKNKQSKIKTKSFEESFTNFLKTIQNKEVQSFIKECAKND